MKIAVCTATRSGWLHNDNHMSFVKLMVLASKRRIELVPLIVPGCSLIHRARNRMVAAAKAEGCAFAFMLDDDVGYEPADLLKLVDYGVDIVAGAPARRNLKATDAQACVVRLAPKPGTQEIVALKFEDGRRLWRAEAAATAFMCIKIDVFDKLEPLTQRYYSDDSHVQNLATRNWFWLDLLPLPEAPQDRLHDTGEDYNFCFKWRALGGDIWIDPDVRLRHYDGNVCFDYCPADMEVKQPNG